MCENIQKTAYEIAKGISSDDTFCLEFSKVAIFLYEQPHLITQQSEKDISNCSILKKLAQRMLKGRIKKKPSYPKTSPDKMVAYILEQYYNINDKSLLDAALENHNRAMSAENIIGTILEAYIASVSTSLGWIWCSGSVVKSVDFLKPSSNATAEWQLLQIKNRSNSENSSSAAIRNDTSIQKWYRSDAKTGKCMWENFPDSELRNILSEEGFRKFATEYLESQT